MRTALVRSSQATPDDLDYAFGVNVRAAMILIKTFAPGMRDAKFGRIVSMSSRAALGKTQRTAYSAAKAALIDMTRTLSLELAGDGITVNAVAPGPIATELFDNGHPIGSEKRQRDRQRARAARRDPGGCGAR